MRLQSALLQLSDICVPRTRLRIFCQLPPRPAPDLINYNAPPPNFCASHFQLHRNLLTQCLLILCAPRSVPNSRHPLYSTARHRSFFLSFAVPSYSRRAQCPFIKIKSRQAFTKATLCTLTLRHASEMSSLYRSLKKYIYPLCLEK